MSPITIYVSIWLAGLAIYQAYLFLMRKRLKVTYLIAREILLVILYTITYLLGAVLTRAIL